MPHRVQITGLLLAAGKGKRFGGAKLEAALDGEMLGLHAARTLAGVADTLLAVCNPVNDVFRAALLDLGYRVIDNHDAVAGLSHSLALGVEAAEGEAVLICLADMPRVTSVHLRAIIAEFEASGAAIASAAAGHRSPPALFPRADWPLLARQTGDKGARELIQNARPVAADPAILIDIDTRADLERR